jgi:hypothetical protein
MTYYIALDGDDIGNKVATNFIENNDDKLAATIQHLHATLAEIQAYLIVQGFEIIYCAADGITCKGNKLEPIALANYVKAIGKPHFTFSVGIGNDLRSSYFALKYAKAIGKNKTIIYANGIDFQVLA